MPSDNQPHDAFFKAIFSQPEAAAFALRRVLPPPVVDAIDWAGLEPVPTESVDAELTLGRADLIFRAPLAGRAVWFDLMLEHQSTVPRRMPLRFLGYMLPVWRRADRETPADAPLPVIVPVVIYHGARRWTGPLAFEDMFDIPEPLGPVLRPHVPAFRLVLDDLRRAEPVSDTAGMALAVVGLSLLRHAPHDPDLRPVLDRLVPHLAAVARMDQGELYFAQIARYVLDVGQAEASAVRDALVRRVPSEMKEVVMTAGEQLRAEGRVEGRAEALRDALLKMSRLKFGVVPPGLEERARSADADTLDRWTDRLLEAERFEDIFD